MDQFQFFQEAASLICNNLAIEQALQACVLYLQEYMPVERMNLQRFDMDFGTMHTIATATVTEVRKLDVLIPVSAAAKKVLRLHPQSTEKDVRIFNQPQEVLLCREMQAFLGMSYSSLMVLRLRNENTVFGSLVVLGNAAGGFTTEHADLLELLKKPFVIALVNALAHREVLKLRDLLADDNHYLQSELRRHIGQEIIGANFGLKTVTAQVNQVAALDSPVLLLGETGVGKDVIAGVLHNLSQRRSKPFITVNCGAIPESLIDSELFGHEKGAFTGAVSPKRGRFERADKGTIFLDEIGELPPAAQVRLLRVLQNKEIERVGGTKSLKLDIRIIAATNRNLEQMVHEKLFREDLWFRLNVFPIWIPPLRNRKIDIPALVQHFIHLKSRELKLPAIPVLADGAIERLMQYDWPGNVRELQNVVERALILNPTGPLTFEQLVQNVGSLPSTAVEEKEIEPLDTVIIRHIRRALKHVNGKIHGPGGAAELLAINPSTLRNRIKKLKIRE